MKQRALIIFDEETIQGTLCSHLERLACLVLAVQTERAALAALEHDSFDLVFLDAKLGETSRLGPLSRLIATRPEVPIIVSATMPKVEDAVEAMRRGAFDYIAAPPSFAQVESILKRFSHTPRLPVRSPPQPGHSLTLLPDIELTTQSPRMKAVLDLVDRAARSDAPILLCGESGTGKSVFARLIHTHSPRATGPFVLVNCPTLSSELLASELFGHARGSFTGALRDEPGRVEDAAGGTLFLDEISEISPDLQAKLLGFLQDKSFTRIGEPHARRVDVRVIAATNRDLKGAVSSGRFREDLLYRLNVIEISIPSLRDRREDIPHLTRALVESLSCKHGRAAPTVSQQAQELLVSSDWPGNVRELRNVIERAIVLRRGEILGPDAFSVSSASLNAPTHRLGEEVSLEVIEREHIERVVAHTPTLYAAAQILGIDESTLRRKRRRHADGRERPSQEAPSQRRFS